MTFEPSSAGRDELTSDADRIFELCLLSCRCETSADEEGHCRSTRPDMSFAYQRIRIVKRLIASMLTATESGEIDCVSFNDNFVFGRYSSLVNNDNRIHSRLVRCNKTYRSHAPSFVTQCTYSSLATGPRFVVPLTDTHDVLIGYIPFLKPNPN
jgi:hypothetical protein